VRCFWKIFYICGLLNVAISDSSVNQKQMESNSHGVILSIIPMGAWSD